MPRNNSSSNSGRKKKITKKKHPQLSKSSLRHGAMERALPTFYPHPNSRYRAFVARHRTWSPVPCSNPVLYFRKGGDDFLNAFGTVLGFPAFLRFFPCRDGNHVVHKKLTSLRLSLPLQNREIYLVVRRSNHRPMPTHKIHGECPPQKNLGRPSSQH